MLIIFLLFYEPSAMSIIFSLKSIKKTIIGFSLWFSALEMYNKTIIGWGFCDMPNYQCRGKSYQPRLRLSWYSNSYLDIDNSAYHKNFIQQLFI